MKGSIEAINREARERGMSYGKYLALQAAQEAPASGREGKTAAEPKRSAPPGSGRGQALRQIRLRAGLSLEEAAWRMDVTASAVRQWETGKNRPKRQSQRKIAQAYGLEPKELERMLEARP